MAKPAIDDRFDQQGIPAFHTHTGNAFPAVRLPSHGPMLPGLSPREMDTLHAADFIALDEAHMFPAEELRSFVHTVVIGNGKSVALVGLDADSQGRPFRGILELLPFATSAQKLVARCHVCADPAPLTVRTAPLIGGNWIGGSEAYATLCFCHWTAAMRTFHEGS